MKHQKRKGYVYVLTNPSMPGLVKIGHSQHGGEARAKSLRTTGVPAPFCLEFEILVPNARALESIIHQRLSGRRLDQGREYFEMHPMEAVEAILSVSLEYAKRKVGSLDCDKPEPTPVLPEVEKPAKKDGSGTRVINHIKAVLESSEGQGHA